jgi:hypothetical protein
MKGWLMVAPAGVVDKRQLERYVDDALAFVAGLPAKHSALAVYPR